MESVEVKCTDKKEGQGFPIPIPVWFSLLLTQSSFAAILSYLGNDAKFQGEGVGSNSIEPPFPWGMLEVSPIKCEGTGKVAQGMESALREGSIPCRKGANSTCPSEHSQAQWRDGEKTGFISLERFILVPPF